uniref:O-antigen ligase-related domain-containing protein n=1 Tax=Roseihalotalea indica TaxID=2867963 RepID=A0AA49GJ88_9BACT|nr:hypothetical protein K4G66_20135 [Tunicatimonas sp. TK19036]
MRISIPEQKISIDYLLVYLLAAISGMPFFSGDIPVLGTFGLAFLVFLLRKEGFHRGYFFILFAFLVLVCLHSLRFDNFPTNTYIGLFIKISLGYLVVALTKEKFTYYYVDVIYYLSIISFFIFIPIFISQEFGNLFNSLGLSSPFGEGGEKSLIVYHLNLDRPEGMYRNCGAFWEPAAHGGFLLIALMFNLINTNSLTDKKSLVLIITLISTLSTSVFVLLAFLVFSYLFFNQKLIVKIITVPIVVIGFIYAFTSIPFLGEKIEREVEQGNLSEEVKERGHISHTRLSSGLADIEDLKENPLIGRGLFELTFYDPTDVMARHNGLTKHFAQFGIIGALIYFGAIFLSFKKLINFSNINRFMAWPFIILMLMMGIAEAYFDKPFFWGLVFIYIVISSNSVFDEDQEYAEEHISEKYAFHRQ